MNTRSCVTCVTCCLSITLGAWLEEPTVNASMVARLDKIAASAEAAIEAHDVPAISIGIVCQDQVYFLSRGVMSRGANTKVDENSAYQVASLAKMFVGIVAHELLVDGKLKLDDSITQYLPRPLSKETTTRISAITIEHLLQHRSGLPRNSTFELLAEGRLAASYDYSEQDFYVDLERIQLDSAPGTTFKYSNFGYALLAHICENASGAGYADLLATHVTSRYHMPATSLSLGNAQRSALVTAYHDADRTLAVPPWSMGRLGPPSTVFCTVRDLTSIMTAQLSAYRDYKATKVPTSLVLTHNARDAWPHTGIKYGYGFFDWGEGTFGHGGGMDGYGSEYSISPERNFGVTFLTSSCGNWTQRLAIRINSILTGTDKAAWLPYDPAKRIATTFTQHGPQEAMELYERLRTQSPHLLSEEHRLTLIGLAKDQGLDAIATRLVEDAVEDYPNSEAIEALVK